jgi:hypothetical protein
VAHGEAFIWGMGDLLHEHEHEHEHERVAF